MTIRTFIIDDHPVVRAGIKQIIQETGDMAVTREASNGKEALSMIS